MNKVELIPATIFNDYQLNDKKLVIAVSGGKDSMALMHYLKHLNPVIAHLDHQLRPNSSHDAQLVKNKAQQYGLKGIAQTTNIAKLAAGDNIEATARKERYKFLEEVRQKHNADYIVTAHHQDDQVETILLNYQRGTGLIGLIGMPIFSNRRRLLRPMLKTSQSQVIAYVQSHNLQFHEDETNQDTSYRRNQLRHETIPQLRKLMPNFENEIVSLGLLAKNLQQQLSLAALTADIKFKADYNGEWYFDRQHFRSLPSYLQKQWLYQTLKHLEETPSHYLINKLQQLCNQHQSGKKLLGEKLNIIVEPRKVIISK